MLPSLSSFPSKELKHNLFSGRETEARIKKSMKSPDRSDSPKVMAKGLACPQGWRPHNLRSPGPAVSPKPSLFPCSPLGRRNLNISHRGDAQASVSDILKC